MLSVRWENPLGLIAIWLIALAASCRADAPAVGVWAGISFAFAFYYIIDEIMGVWLCPRQ